MYIVPFRKLIPTSSLQIISVRYEHDEVTASGLKSMRFMFKRDNTQRKK